MNKSFETREVLPPRQLQVLNFIREFINISGYPPSIEEIMDGINVASSFGVRKHLEALERKGYITREPTLSRAIRIID